MGDTMGKTGVNMAHGPDWGDVTDYVAYVQEEYHKDVHFRMELSPLGKGREKLFIECYATRKGDDGQKMGRVSECATWPHPDCRTMAALHYHLLVRLDTKLMRRRGEAERQAAF
jgi:hypothetical protein